MKQLPLSDAVELFVILSPYLPDDKASTNILEFTGKIVENLQKSENQQNYFTAISLMTGKNTMDFLKIGAVKTLELFMDGLVINNILALKDFCEKVGFNG
jgi:hypothetical protein